MTSALTGSRGWAGGAPGVCRGGMGGCGETAAAVARGAGAGDGAVRRNVSSV
jgi:hypothetical protein